MSELKAVHIFPSGQRLEITEGDITSETVDAIVNAANEHLLHGGGVAGVISRKGGPIIQQESNEWVRKHGQVSHVQPAYTSAGALPAQYVIHAVGPVWGSGDEETKLADAILGSLMLAEKLSIASIAFPAISTGIFGFPKDRAARVFFSTVKQFIQTHPHSLVRLVRLTLFDSLTLTAFLSVFESSDFQE